MNIPIYFIKKKKKKNKFKLFFFQDNKMDQ